MFTRILRYIVRYKAVRGGHCGGGGGGSGHCS